MFDLLSYLAPVRHLNTAVGSNPGDHRRNVVGFASWIDVTDMASIVTVKPPMLNGARAYNGPSCPWP